MVTDVSKVKQIVCRECGKLVRIGALDSNGVALAADHMRVLDDGKKRLCQGSLQPAKEN